VSTGGSSSTLAEVVAAADSRLRPYAREAPAAGDLDLNVPDPDRAFTLEAVREGYLLHYGEPRAFERMEPDLRLLAGDALYALGLERVARAGDIAAIAELADLISLCAWAHSAGRQEAAPDLWRASIAALSGSGPGARATIPL
jgi:hypothetical protein